jgi:uncharacterized protein (UPF0335 family)
MSKTWGKDAGAKAAATPADEYDPAEVTRETLRAGSNNGMNRQLYTVVERVERLTEEKSALGDDIKEVYDEAKAAGFDTKIIRKVIKRRSADTASLQEEDALLQLYEDAVKEAQAAALRTAEPEDGQ